MYRPLWSSEILREVGDVLENKLKLTTEQRERRIGQMQAAFPEALVDPPKDLAVGLVGIPDENDRHVLAAAITGQAHVIVTNNPGDFPIEYLAQFDILRHSADDFLIHQFHLNPYLVLERLDAQAVNIRRERRAVLSSLKILTPKFVELVESFF
jgi:predicted nucleic acid-binding protein